MTLFIHLQPATTHAHKHRQSCTNHARPSKPIISNPTPTKVAKLALHYTAAICLQSFLPDRFERVNTKGAVFAWLACDVALWAVALRENGEQNVILSCHAKIGGKIGARLADESSLNEVVVLAGWALDALDGDLCVGVVVPIIVTYANLKTKTRFINETYNFLNKLGQIQWGMWNPDLMDFIGSKRGRVCKWYTKFWMGSDVWKPDHLKSGKMVAMLSKIIWNLGKNVHILNGQVFK